MGKIFTKVVQQKMDINLDVKVAETLILLKIKKDFLLTKALHQKLARNALRSAGLTSFIPTIARLTDCLLIVKNVVQKKESPIIL